MAKSTSTATTDLTRLSQSQAAFAIGQPASFLRNNSHKVQRNSDGTYDVRRLFSAFTAGEADLSDLDAERALKFAELSVRPIDDQDSHDVVAFLVDLENRLGLGGLVAAMRLVKRQWEQITERCERRRPKTEAEIREQLEQRVQDERRYQGLTLFDMEFQCMKCGKVRRGEKWKQQRPNDKHEVDDAHICPTCVDEGEI